MTEGIVLRESKLLCSRNVYNIFHGSHYSGEKFKKIAIFFCKDTHTLVVLQNGIYI